MAKNGIKAVSLSYNRRMEQQTIEKQVSTTDEWKGDVRISRREAEEYRAYKRKQLQADIVAALSLSESAIAQGDDVQRVCERAIRLRQAAVKTPLTKLALASRYLSGSRVRLDCVVGGTGETLTKVKTLETRLAVKNKAAEITLLIAPSLVDGCRYGEIRREIKRVRRAAGKLPLKVRVEQTSSMSVLSRIARIACEAGAKYLSIPYFAACEGLRTSLGRGCALEVSNVQTTEVFQRLTKAGVARLVTDRGWEIYAEWLKQGYEQIEPPMSATKEEKQETSAQETPTQSPPNERLKDPETDYRCKVVGTKLTFY